MPLIRCRCAAIRSVQTSHADDAQRRAVHGNNHILGLWPGSQLIVSSITTPPTRKRQKKADSRVAELERKIDALTATLHAQKTGAPDVKHHGGIPQHDSNAPPAPIPEGSYRAGMLNHDWSSPNATKYPDIPPGYGPAQTIQRGPEPKRRRLGNGHAVSVI